jgi:hypothetical protein
VFVSPRRRARKTFELLLPLVPPLAEEWEEKVTFTEEIAEWDYGDYEGLKVGEIRELRKGRGLDGERAWDILRDGCEGGEYVVPPPRSPLSFHPFLSLVPSFVYVLTDLQVHAASQRASRRARLANPRDTEAWHGWREARRCAPRMFLLLSLL